MQWVVKVRRTQRETVQARGSHIYQRLLNIEQSLLAEEMSELQILGGHENIGGKYQHMLVLEIFVIFS